MLPKKRVPAHPGQVLRDQFLKPYGITQVRLAKHIRRPVAAISEIITGKKRMTAETAWQLASAFGSSPHLWMYLQVAHDLVKHKPKRLPKRIKPHAS